MIVNPMCSLSLRPVAVLRANLELNNLEIKFTSKCIESTHWRDHCDTSQGLQKAHASHITVERLGVFTQDSEVWRLCLIIFVGLIQVS